MKRVQLPFGNPATPVNADCATDPSVGPLIALRDTNGCPILTLGVTGDGYLVHIAEGVTVGEGRLTLTGLGDGPA